MADGDQFPVLKAVSGILIGLGWVVLIGGVLCSLAMPLPSGFESGGLTFKVIMAVAVAVFGLIVIAFGEAIGVLFAIEENTRRSR